MSNKKDDKKPMTIEAGGLRAVFLQDGVFTDDEGGEHDVHAGIKVSGIGKYPVKFSAIQLATLVNICRDPEAKKWLTERLTVEKEQLMKAGF